MPLNLPHRSQSELQSSLDQTLSQNPHHVNGVWLFVYGLLAKQPPFNYESHQTVTLQGYQRRFNLADPMNRGTPGQPGLTLGLEKSGQCHGIAYFIPSENLTGNLTKVWQQEMLLPFYIPSWVSIEDQIMLVMLTDPASPALRPNLPFMETARIIARGQGEAGTNLAYLTDVVEAFAKHGIRDCNLTAITEILSTQHAA